MFLLIEEPSLKVRRDARRRASLPSLQPVRPPRPRGTNLERKSCCFSVRLPGMNRFGIAGPQGHHALSPHKDDRHTHPERLIDTAVGLQALHRKVFSK